MADHEHPIIDADPHFSIDITNRTITNSKSKKVSLIQYDHNSERFSFDIDREIEGHDIMNCNRIQIHYINTSASTRTKHIGLYEVTDKKVHPDNDKKVCFTWLISDNATHYEGMLSFLIAFECVDGEEILYRWNSGICNAISIVAGINNNNAVSEVYVDELLKWENYIVDHFDELETELVSTTIPALVDERYVEREFATSEEVAAIFALEMGDALTITLAEVVQNTGQSAEAVMSQKATTDSLTKKLDIDSSETDYAQVYGKDYTGAQTMYDIASGSTPLSLVRRDSNGRFNTGTAVDEANAINKGQFDTALAKKLDKLTYSSGELWKAYVEGKDDGYLGCSATVPTAAKETLVQRASNGYFDVKEAESDKHPVPLSQVKSLISDKQDKITSKTDITARSLTMDRDNVNSIVTAYQLSTKNIRLYAAGTGSKIYRDVVFKDQYTDYHNFNVASTDYLKTINGESIVGTGNIEVSGGGKLYRHMLYISLNDGSANNTIHTILYNSSSVGITTVEQLLQSIGQYHYHMASGTLCDSNWAVTGIVCSLVTSSNDISVEYLTAFGSGTGEDSISSYTVVDVVMEV